MGKQKDAHLILELYDLRRETVMREARNWFFAFNPTNIQDFIDVIVGDKSAFYRMVVSYWEMAASLVNHGAIDEQMFNDANGEHIFVFAKIEPFLADLRGIFGSPTYLANLEKVVRQIPDIDERIDNMRERMAQLRALRDEKAAKVATAKA